ncbi:M23 family metallopeptidase [Ruthenibacterium lactatiformans]
MGYVGSTGNSTGNHLHFEVWENGQRMDAMEYYTIN